MDDQGGVLPAATVTVTNADTGATRTGVTDSNGRYVITNLQPGRYEISAELRGFAKNSGTVILPVGGATEFNPRLGVAGTEETIQVTSETPAINVINAEQATTISEEQIRELPTLTRNVYDLVAIAGNVRSATDDRQMTSMPAGPGFNINGQRVGRAPTSCSTARRTTTSSMPTSARTSRSTRCRSSRVITNNFSAQYGRATGGIVNVITKSGTNKLLAARPTSSSVTTSWPRTRPTTTRTTSRRASSSATSRATASAGRSCGTRCISSRASSTSASAASTR